MSASVDPIDAVRNAFPAIVKNPDYIFSENAGGSQVLGSVVAKISSYLVDTNVQMADYQLAKAAKARVDAGYAATALYLGHDVSPDEVMFGASATQLVENLSRMIEESIIQQHLWVAGDEIVITEADHETNRGAWKRLAARHGLVIKQWKTSEISPPSVPNPTLGKELHTANLADVVNERTRLVCFTACSNVLGKLVDIPAAVKIIKEKSGGKAWTCVDAVAYAPHRRPKPKDLGVDFMFWSWYKVFGPHIGAMYLSRRAQEQLLTKLNHHFVQHYPGTYPFQPSSQQYELIYSVTAVVEYLVALGSALTSSKISASTLAEAPEVKWVELQGDAPGSKALSQVIDAAYDWIASHEDAMLAVCLHILRKPELKDAIQIVGDVVDGTKTQTPIIAFTIGSLVVRTSLADAYNSILGDSKMGAQRGHMYAYDMIKALGLQVDDGVIRFSLAHYNTTDEARKIVETVAGKLTGADTVPH
ncbi:unnamed protein product [Tilletia controversa]|uniref:Aminotransferase class V domain-containing protein n=2 Tax=Tilletia TaxID=13289 RepID=A0A177VIA3_9BASI|nr:hypothetical protein CF328_g4906 [Tilletia controversa]KAE8194906.1 hypothetical protein CF336_g3324 [Tilletia laevis]KAE8257871.1 hypothetical protein A4X03_0g4540 [Tilletia caries]KAE8197905.1 hypothetical protein CF335_g4510 [Tilletia laevis]CAD6886024.1 unnamed protein product [Tilletia caries]